MDASQRIAALLDLVALSVPIVEAVDAVRSLPWDSDDELVLLDRASAASVLLRYRSGQLTAAELEKWADTIEGRDDIGFEVGHEQTLSQFIFATANPALVGPLDDGYGILWGARLSSL